MTARGLILGELDALEFMVARDCGMSLSAVRALPNVELEEWRGWYQVQAQRRELETLKANARG